MKNHKVCPYCGEIWITQYNQCCFWKCFVNYCVDNAIPFDEFNNSKEIKFQFFENSIFEIERTIDDIECQIEEILDDDENEDYLKGKIEKIWAKVRSIRRKLY
jgi:uncharacterized membrane protein YukC